MANVSKTTDLLAMAEEAAGDFDPPAGFWVHDHHNWREALDYCPACIDAAVAAASVSGLWADDPHEEYWQQPYAAGGYRGGASDHSPACENCGCQLWYCLTAYGASEEIAHFLEHGIGRGAQSAYELARAVEAAEDLTAEDVARLSAALAAVREPANV
jgi:hypothetical protein